MQRPWLVLLMATLVAGLCSASVVVLGADKKADLGVEYDVKGTLGPVRGQTFPKSWGRLVSGSVAGQYVERHVLTFEAEDGTVRLVHVDVNFGKGIVNDIEVITIARDETR